MMQLADLPLGIYEKAMKKEFSWSEKIALALKYGYRFIEISIDESDDRLARLESSRKDRKELHNLFFDAGMPLYSICLSGNRKFPLGSSNPEIRRIGMELITKAIDYALDLGVRIIQLAGYDVYYEENSTASRELFYENIAKVIDYAEKSCVTLSVEIMDHPFMNSVAKYLELKKRVPSPWLQLYPDIGNLCAWNDDLEQELIAAGSHIVSVHLKDTLKVTPTHPGTFRDILFGTGCVDFVTAFKTLAEIGYHGPLLVEMWGESSSSHEHLGTARRWLLKQMELAQHDSKPAMNSQ
jgi:L-ribulose-5-phosphate 3-epimerase